MYQIRSCLNCYSLAVLFYVLCALVTYSVLNILNTKYLILQCADTDCCISNDRQSSSLVQSDDVTKSLYSAW